MRSPPVADEAAKHPRRTRRSTRSSSTWRAPAVGAFETAALVRKVANEKPVTATVNGLAASAADAIASGASRIITIESGVVVAHAGMSKKLENDGIRPTIIHAGKHKATGLRPTSPNAAVPRGLQRL
jgi:ClpP class serine protease